ncbi:MAG TPA: sulfatase [Fimbriiglobus sp.]|nr:sulfatase [Fimbriiglobus sp.]
MRTRTLIVALVALGCASRLTAADRPNVFFAIADDWGYPFAGAYDDPAAKTPTFDRVAREGVLFTRAFASSPSCTPSRAAILTGQFHWRLEESANLWSTLQAKFKTYPELLHDAGYAVGHSRKAWGPGRLGPGGRTQDPSGPTFKNFGAFLKARPKGTPFCFWFGSSDPHRPYVWQSGRKSGIDPAKVRLPSCLPDRETVRDDVADYLFEVERFDREVGEALALLKETGELDNTIVVVTGDHGMPFPRGKSNLYDLGTRVPLAVRWPAKIKAGRTADDFVSLTDLAPTFLEAAGVKVPDDVTGKSLVEVLTTGKAGRDHVIYGKERHVPSQEKGNLGGYPSRAIRTTDFLYIRNFKPDLWPNGIPDAAKAQIANSFADCDNGPTKSFLIEHKDDPEVRRSYDLAFAKRPAEELYDLRKDPDQLTNVADRPEYAKALGELREKLTAELKATKDPRVLGGGDQFDRYPYYGGRQKPPKKTGR